jgi:hypothetical protein
MVEMLAIAAVSVFFVGIGVALVTTEILNKSREQATRSSRPQQYDK